MKPKTMVLMMVAVGCGLVASIMTSRLIADRGQNNEPRVKVLAAKKKLKALTALTKPEELFMEKDLPQDAVPKKAIKGFEELKDKRLNKPLNEEAIVTLDDVVGKDLLGLDVQLPQGMRAYSMKVNAESQVAGFIVPGTRVDVISTTRDDNTSQIILQDMLILAVDTQNNRNTEDGSKAMPASTVTLAVTPEEATRLSLASNLGELRLMLRALNDNEKIQVRHTRRGDLNRPLHKSAEAASTAEENAVAMSPNPQVPELPPTPTDPPANPMIEMPPEPQPEPEQPKTHTLTILSGEAEIRHTYVQQKDGSWRLGNVDRKEGDEPNRPAKPRAGWPKQGVPAGEKKDQPRIDQPEPREPTLQEAQQALQKVTGLPPVNPK